MSTSTVLIGAYACFVELWGVGYLIVGLTQVRRSTNNTNKPPGEDLS